MEEPKAPADDPSTEDILASIRRILADEDAAAEAGQEPGPAAQADRGADVFVLDQTMLIEEPPPLAPMDTPPPGPVAEPPPPDAQRDDRLLARTSEAAAQASLGALVRVVERQQISLHRGGPTLEEMVRDEIRPLVKTWLDEHLPPMVERLVRAEIARLTGGS